MPFSHHFSFALATFCGAFSLVHGNLCAFGCREFPQHQIVSSAQFRSFIMPRERGDCVGNCCGGVECGAAESVEDGEGYGAGGDGERSPKTKDGEETEERKSALPDIAAFLKALLPRQNSENADKKFVWYSTAGIGQPALLKHERIGGGI
ncbi:hypothetical protein GPALN_005611 [Globodera pallida]|nr:hypothetical protein GPALN_005611 [Globodera pallida]